MKTKVLKSMLLVAAAIVLVIASVLGTMAYLTSSSAVSNVFTVGNIRLEMYESKVDEDGKVVEGAVDATGKKTADTNSYKLKPGMSYIKDPTVYIDSTSDESYLFVRLRNDLKAIEMQNSAEHPTILQQMRENGWFEISRAESNVDAVFVYVGDDFVDENGKDLPTLISEVDVSGCEHEYQRTEKVLNALKDKVKAKVVGGDGARQDIDVFDTFTLSPDCSDKLLSYGGARVDIVAYAIQIDGEISKGGIGEYETYMKAWQYIKESLPFVE